eukprot:SM000001S04543  [mRNA]  locus=s1:841502:842944:- [translate_table: standard]
MIVTGATSFNRFAFDTIVGCDTGLMVVGLVVARELRPVGGAGELPLTTVAATAEVGDGSPYPYAHLRNLVMVAGHAVYVSRRCGSASSEDSWFLEPYQRLAGQAATFVEHIRTGVEAAAGDSAALLMFSGGQTRSAAGPRSEAQSYWKVADTLDWFGEAPAPPAAVSPAPPPPSPQWSWMAAAAQQQASAVDVCSLCVVAAAEQPEVAARALTEEFARDSLENLLFSICRFHELTGAYPNNITVCAVPTTAMPIVLGSTTSAAAARRLRIGCSLSTYVVQSYTLTSRSWTGVVVSYDFKRTRFAELHREALGFPAARFHFIGTPVTASNRLSAKVGERRTVAAFAYDPFGCSEALHGKRVMRNPFARTLPYPRGCPELGILFAHCDRSANAARIRTPLPWS